MTRIYIPLILFSFLVLEGVALELLPHSLVNQKLDIVPHWIFMLLVLVAIFYDREHTHISIIYAAVFGLLIDVVYTGILGVYMFTYAGAIFIVKGLSRILQSNLLSIILFSSIGLIIADISIQLIYFVIGLVHIEWKVYFMVRLLPTILANIIFLIICYPFMIRGLTNWKNRIHEDL